MTGTQVGDCFRDPSWFTRARRLWTASECGAWLHAGERRPLRVQFVITSMPVGGAETLLVNMLRRFDPAEIAAEVICLKDPGPLGEEIAGEFPVHANLIGGKWDAAVTIRLARLMRRRRADAVITVGAGDKMFWGRLAAAIAGVPMIAAALHSTGWPDGVGRINRMLTPLTDAFIGVAESHGEFLRTFERFPASKVHVVRNGVDTVKFNASVRARQSVREELGLSRETRLVGIVAALRPEKNHAMFAYAAERLAARTRDTHWLIIGDGPERARLESLAIELGIADRIHLLGTRSDTPRLVASLDVFTLCSLNEASPVSILEALACRVPVVATDVGSVGETVINGKTGWLVPSQDLDAYAAAILRLLSDPAERAGMGDAGRDLVTETGSLDAMVRGYRELVRRQCRRFADAEPVADFSRTAASGRTNVAASGVSGPLPGGVPSGRST